MLTFSHSTPEQQGISSASILRFIDRLQKKEVPMHSFLLLRGKTILAEGYYAPYRSDTLHRMLSIAKSFVSIGIGLCEADGLLSLDDPIINFFPEYSFAATHPWIRTMTIRNMLMMRTCHATTTYKVNEQADWIESFFTVPPTHKPGTIFHYDTSAAHVLCALIERLTHKNCLTYIKEKLAPLGLSDESYLLTDPFGHSHGGSGLVALPMDLLRFGYLLLHEGNIDGEQLVPASFIRTATSCLTATRMTAPIPSEAAGYGFMIWQNEKGGFVCYGMGGQLCIVLPQYDLICVTTADTQGIGGGNQLIYDAFYEEILAGIKPGEATPLAADGAGYEALKKRLQELSIQPLVSPIDKTAESARQRLSSYIGRSYQLEKNSSGFENLQFTAAESASDVRIQFSLNQSTYAFDFGFRHLCTGIFPLYPYRYAASGAWLDEDTLYVRVHLIDSCIGSLHFEFHFGKDDLTVFMKKIEETMFQEFNGHFYASRYSLTS